MVSGKSYCTGWARQCPQDLSLARACKGLNHDGLHCIKLLCIDKGQCIENNHTKDFKKRGNKTGIQLNTC